MTEQEAAAILQIHFPAQQNEIEYACLKRQEEIRSLYMTGMLDDKQANDQLWQLTQAERILAGGQLYGNMPVSQQSWQIGVDDLTRSRVIAQIESPIPAATNERPIGYSRGGLTAPNAQTLLSALLIIIAFFLLTYWTVSDFAAPVQTATATVANKYFTTGKGASENLVLNWAGNTADISVYHSDYVYYNIGQRVRIDYRHYNILITAFPQYTVLALDGHPRDVLKQHNTLFVLWLVTLVATGLITRYIAPRTWW